MLVRLHGHTLPGREFDGFEQVHVGLQRRKEPNQLVPGDAVTADLVAEVEVVRTPAGLDFLGPYVHGNRADRFLYLTWGDHPNAGTFTMFGRAKIRFSWIGPGALAAAVESALSTVRSHSAMSAAARSARP